MHISLLRSLIIFLDAGYKHAAPLELKQFPALQAISGKEAK